MYEFGPDDLNDDFGEPESLHQAVGVTVTSSPARDGSGSYVEMQLHPGCTAAALGIALKSLPPAAVMRDMITFDDDPTMGFVTFWAGAIGRPRI